MQKIIVKFSYSITHKDISHVKEYAKSQKDELQEIFEKALRISEKELAIRFLTIFEVTATYYDDYESPVISISGEAFDINVPVSEIGHWLYVKAFCCPDREHVCADIFRKQ